MDVQSIYPQPEENGNKPDATLPVTASDTPEHSIGSAILSSVYLFFAGLIIISIIGLIGGAAVGRFLVRESGYFSGISNTIGLLFFVGPLTVVFGFVAFATKQWKYALYPLLAFIMTGRIDDTQFIDYVRLLLPLEPTGTNRGLQDGVTITVIVLLSYVLIYLLDKAVFSLIVLIRRRRKDFVASAVTLLLVLLLLVPALVFVPVFGREAARERASLRIPANTEYFGMSDYRSERVDYSFSMFDLVYGEATQQTDGIYQVVDDVHYQNLDKWWQDDIRQNCYENFKLSLFPDQTGKNEYFTTDSGNEYAKSTFQEKYFYSSPSEGSVYKVRNNIDRYCFVIDNKKYELVRSDQYGTAYQEKYPVEEVIDAFFAAQAYYPDCYQDEFMARKAIPRHCAPGDAEAIIELESSSFEKINVPRNSEIGS